MPTTSLRIITIVVCTIGLLSLICVGTLAYCMICSVQVPEGLNAAFTGVTGGLVGALTGLLVNTRSPHAGEDESSIPVTVQNTASQPVPTTERS